MAPDWSYELLLPKRIFEQMGVPLRFPDLLGYRKCFLLITHCHLKRQKKLLSLLGLRSLSKNSIPGLKKILLAEDNEMAQRGGTGTSLKEGAVVSADIQCAGSCETFLQSP
ncbi:MAG: hypothetical protein ACLUKE_08670 [Blautia wexlerae]